MNLSGVSASLIKAQAENHLSLASVNIDFSLLRVQPPSEYLAVGNHLSPQRKEEGDNGQPHVTASKLGLLFDELVPAIPHLIQAYGLRCGETAQAPLFNPKGGKEHGLFASQVGADGTTVWAAATSGNSAIAVHLLACMLARIWDSPKAISIWMELIAVRKQALAASGNPMSVSASRVELTRDQIALWDASTRSWCLTADQANERRQKQLRLIIDHLGLPVSPKPELSPSVMDAWRSAMIMVDKLVAGEPQSAHTGAPLLGLASWHLYPDLIIFGKDREVKEVKQKDHLIHQGGILTLGIEDIRHSDQGIYWSLPLAHLRYYGDPVICETSLHSSTSRLSIDQFIYVAFGSFIRRWLCDVDDIIPAASVLVHLASTADHPPDSSLGPSLSWLSLLAWAAKTLLDSAGDRRADILRLVKCGRRKYPQFMDHPSTHSILGLSSCEILLGLLRNSECRARMLREVAKDFGGSDSTRFMVIQYKTHFTRSRRLCSAQSLYSSRFKGQLHRWFDKRFEKLEHITYELDKGLDGDSDKDALKELQRADKTFLAEIPYFGMRDSFTWYNPPKEFYEPFLLGAYPPEIWCEARGASVRVEFLFGDPTLAALYSIDITTWQQSPNIDARVFKRAEKRDLPNIFMLRHISEATQSGWLDQNALDAHLSHMNITKYYMNITKETGDTNGGKQLLFSLKALLTIWTLYQDLPGAAIELKAANEPLCSHQWLSWDLDHQLNDPWLAFELTQEQIFACIAKFESGRFNFQPGAMNGVLAISTGNSIYVARRLLQDPCRQSSRSIVARVVGTVGKSGMAMLISPETPRVRPTTDNYALVNHEMFNGNAEDCFQHTTLHMSFTEWNLAVDVGSRGIRDIEAHYVETAIGVYDHGKWVADVNIRDVFSHARCKIMEECCKRHEYVRTYQDLGKLVAIDNWDELIDSPPEVAIVRTRGNWQARLACAALSLQRGHETRILPDKICWTCCVELPALNPSSEENNDLYKISSEEVIGTSRRHASDDDSDSDLDEFVEEELARRKRRKVQEDFDEIETLEVPQVHRNRVYIM